jgi:protein TonB
MPEPRRPEVVEAPLPDAVALPWAVEDEGGRLLRRTLVGAVALHALILLAPLPQVAAVEPPAPDPARVIIHQTPRFKPPEIPPEPEIQTPQVVRVAVPDLTPDDPEPIRPFETLASEIEPPEIAWFTTEIPEPPPPEDTGPIRITAGISRPVAIFSPKPDYPEVARKARILGVVVLRTVIDEQGRVNEVEVHKPLTFGLTEAAVDAVSRWRYEPALRKDKRPVAVIMELTVRFSLEG